MTIAPGTRVKSYYILTPLGRGGMAEVYKARHVDLKSDVAIKFMRLDQFPQAIMRSVIKRFQIEAQRMAQLSHPNIVKVSDFGNYKGIPYLVMEYLPGGTLKEHMGAPVPWQDAAKLLLPIAEALAYAHSEGVIHRDVKPANILLAKGGQPMLSDFGVAKIMDSEHTQGLTATGASIGTPEYMAPEQAAGKKIDHRVDVYSLGVIFYELVTGRRPFTADTPMDVIIKQATEPLTPPSRFVKGLPKAVEEVLFTALAKNPGDRFADMGAFATALGGLATGKAMKKKVAPARKKPAAAKVKVVKKAKSPYTEKKSGVSWLPVATGVAAVGLAVFVGMKLFGGRDEPKEIAPIEKQAVVVVEESPTLEVTRTPSPTQTPTVDPYVISKDNIEQIEVLGEVPNTDIGYLIEAFPGGITGVFYNYDTDRITFWDFEKNHEIKKIDLSVDFWRKNIDLLNDGSLLALSTGGILNIYDGNSFELLEEITGNPNNEEAAVTEIAFSPDGSKIAIGVQISLVRILDTYDFGLEIELTDFTNERCNYVMAYNNLPSFIRGLEFSSDGKYLLVEGECNVIVYKTENWEKVYQFREIWTEFFRDEITFIDNKLVVLDGSNLSIIDLNTNKEFCSKQYDDLLSLLDVSTKYLVVDVGHCEDQGGSETKLKSKSGGGVNCSSTIKVIDHSNCEEYRSYDSPYKQPLSSVFLTCDEQLLITGPRHFNYPKIFELDTNNELITLAVDGMYAYSPTLLDGGRFILVRYQDNITRIWGIPQP